MAEVLDEVSQLESTTIGVFRSAATVAGGRRFSFGALVVIGDKRGKVALGYAKANEVPPAFVRTCLAERDPAIVLGAACWLLAHAPADEAIAIEHLALLIDDPDLGARSLAMLDDHFDRVRPWLDALTPVGATTDLGIATLYADRETLHTMALAHADRLGHSAAWAWVFGVDRMRVTDRVLDGLRDGTSSRTATRVLALRASLPLFTGGERTSALRRTRLELSELEKRRELLAQRIEQGIRSALHRVGASSAGIDLSRVSAEASRRNLELVADAYGQGAIDIIDLLDAQNAALIADEQAANAVYDFLIDLLEAQRAAGTIPLVMNADERAAFVERLRSFFGAVEETP